MAMFLVANEMQAADILQLDLKHSLALPNSVVEMFAGSLGTPPGGWPKKLQRIILRGEEPHEGRPGANLEPVDFAAAQAALEKQMEHSVHLDELLTSLLYPEVFAQYDRFRRSYSDVSVLPTPAFFYGLKPGDEITAEIESGKALIIKFLAVGDSRPDGTRLLFFELNGQPREVTVRDRALRVAARANPKADPADPGQVAAPTPGLISGIAVQANQLVASGAKLMTLEAMKMQSNIYAPIAGRIAKILVSTGSQVEAKDLLLTIVP
jgi:pyruvate carboxylase